MAMERTIDFTDISKDIEQDGWLNSNREKADGLLKRMVDELPKKTDYAPCEKADKEPRFEPRFFLQREYHNIIAFTGDRGTGKTTMLNAYIRWIQSENYYEKTKTLDGHKFSVLLKVDPGRQSDGDSLLCAIFARLFDEIRRQFDNKCSIGDDGRKKEKCRKMADECSQIIKIIRTKAITVKESIKEFSDSSDYMEEYSTIVSLRERIYVFVKEYLKELAEKRFLVIPIDDLDTNIRDGFDIICEIHQYLSLPNIIIVMAAKIEQLSDLIKYKYIYDFNSIRNDSPLPAGLGNAEYIGQQPSEMAEKYLEKFIPVYSRIPMKQLRLHNLSNVNIILHEGDSESDKHLVERFIKLILDKTLIQLVKDDSGAHPLIPLNLRALYHTLQMLEGLKTISKANINEKSTRESLKDNLDQVENWLVESITSNAVPQELAAAFQEASVHSSEGFCAFLVHRIKIFNHKLKETNRLVILDEEDRAIKGIFNAVRPDKTCCLGDVLFLLDKIIERDSDEGYRHFASAVKMLFSLRATSHLMAYSGNVPEFAEVSKLLGSLIVHPEVRLTAPTGSEWNTRCELGELRVKVEFDGVEKNYYLRGNVSGEAKDAISVEAVLWLSMFVVSPQRVTDYHLPYADLWSDKLPFLRSMQHAVNISTHWLRFATALLEPEETAKKLLWMINGVENTKEYKKFIDLIKVKDASELPLPLNSIDVLHALTTKMSHNRLTYNERIRKYLYNIDHDLDHDHDHLSATDRLPSFVYDEYRIFRRNLYESLKSVYGIRADKCPEIECESCDQYECYNDHRMKNLRDYTPPKLDKARNYLTAFERLNVFRAKNI